MDKYSEVNTAIALVYQAVMAPEHWPNALAAISSLLEADKAVFVTGDTSSVMASTVQHNHDPERLLAYNEIYHRQDPWWGPLQSVLPGTAIHVQKLKPISEITHTEYYHDHLVTADIGDSLVSILDDNAGIQSAIGFQRRLKQDAFTPAQGAMLQTLIPHLVNAVKMNWQLTQHAIRESLQISGQAPGLVLILDDKGRVLGPDNAAETIAARTSVLKVTHNRLQAAAPADQNRLEAALNSVLHEGIGQAFPLKDPGYNAPVILRASPLPEAAQMRLRTMTDNLAVICVDLPVTPTLSGVFVVSETYGLSAKEQALLTSFSESYNLRATADALDITYETARWHLKQILAKTGTHNQAELLVKTAQAAR
ncbi:helix-turn-helix transcriptional regulator [Parvularcula sp. IMCC14364]|uniref:helix-turn-helix transcriptional regulator n=1 Tax=Parvularcula sp. IMCC14364 TaxID=3067902 RepID=UPI002740442C|nr:helix-turn-helix transcriptional regulator [Parvularcula sp. IMCC14364]